MATAVRYITFLNTGSNPPFVAGDTILVEWDGYTTFTVFKNNLLVTSGSTITTSESIEDYVYDPVLETFEYQLIPLYVNETTYLGLYDIVPVSFCSGTTLRKIEYIKAFPYVQFSDQANSPSCAPTPTVCDLKFSVLPVITKPSTSSSFDGQIVLTATSSNSGIKYGIGDFNYLTEGQSSGTFTGLLAGTYTFFAKDIAGCFATIDVILTETSLGIYNIIYSLQYKEISNNFYTKFDIYKKNYIGPVIQVDGGSEDPLIFRKRGENSTSIDGAQFVNTVIATECTVTLKSPSSLYFIDLFGADDSKYFAIASKNYGSGYVEFWRGFPSSTLYSEEYSLTENYSVSIDFVDRVSTLKDFDFVDSSGNNIKARLPLIKVVAEILKKTSLELPIRCASNKYEQTYATTAIASEDPLLQTYVECADLYDDDGKSLYDCYDILESIVACFGQLYQSGGYWWLLNHEESYGGTIFSYREFDKDGNYVTNSTLSPHVEIKRSDRSNRLSWINASQILNVQRAVNSAKIIQKLKKRPWYFDNGSAETIDFVEEEFVTRIFYPGWTFVPNGVGGNTPGIFNGVSPDFSGNDSKYGLKIYSGLDTSVTSPYGQAGYLQSATKNISFNASDSVKLSFDYKPEYASNSPYLKIVYSLSIIDGSGNGYYLQSDGTWSTSNQWAESIVSNSSDNWATYSITVKLPNASTSYNKCHIRLMYCGVRPDDRWTIQGYTNFRTITTANKPLGYIAWMWVNNGTYDQPIQFYKLIASNASDNPPGIVRPNDYNSSTNIVAWSLIESIPFLTKNYPNISRWDNVKLDFLPGQNSAPSDKSYTSDNTNNSKNTFSRDIIFGDAPITINNAENVYQHCFVKSDGTHTKNWRRKYRNESLPILSLLSRQVSEQGKDPVYNLTGDLSYDRVVNFCNIVSDFDGTSTRYYNPMYMEIHDRLGYFSTSMLEVKQSTATGQNTNAFSSGFAIDTAFGNTFEI